MLQLEVDASTICAFLKYSGFTRQKLRLVAAQRDEFLRHKFMLDVSAYNSGMFIFLDETKGILSVNMATACVGRPLKSTLS